MEFLGVSGTEFVFLALVALVIFGPTGMPKVARGVLRGWGKVAALRAQMATAAASLQQQAVGDPLVAQLRAEAAQARAELERVTALGAVAGGGGAAGAGAGTGVVGSETAASSVAGSAAQPGAYAREVETLMAPVQDVARSVTADLGKLSR